MQIKLSFVNYMYECIKGRMKETTLHQLMPLFCFEFCIHCSAFTALQMKISEDEKPKWWDQGFFFYLNVR